MRYACEMLALKHLMANARCKAASAARFVDSIEGNPLTVMSQQLTSDMPTHNRGKRT